MQSGWTRVVGSVGATGPGPAFGGQEHAEQDGAATAGAVGEQRYHKITHSTAGLDELLVKTFLETPPSRHFHTRDELRYDLSETGSEFILSRIHLNPTQSSAHEATWPRESWWTVLSSMVQQTR
jgi:hypothetical protein